MRYEREGYYSLPFTLVSNKVSQVINWRLNNVEISGVSKTNTGEYVYSHADGWCVVGTGYRAFGMGNVIGQVGSMIVDRCNDQFRVRVYDPLRDARLNRVQVKISADKHFGVFDEVFKELDVLERELFIGPEPFRRI